MDRTLCTTLTLTALLAVLSADSANGQLSRARRAVRSTSAQPEMQVATTVPCTEPTAEKQPTPVATPAPEPITVTPAAPPPTTLKKQVSIPRPTPTALSTLAAVREKTRSAADLPKPPVLLKAPPNPPRRDRGSDVRHHHRPAFVGRPVHRYPRDNACFVPASPPICCHETLVKNGVVATATVVCDQPLLVPPVEDRIICDTQPNFDSGTELPVTVVEGCANPQSERLTPQCPQPLRFLSFPYQSRNAGVMSCDSGGEWMGSAAFEYGSSFDGLDRRGFGLLVEHATRIGFDFNWDSYVEDLGGGWTDELHLTDINVLFRVAESERYLVRCGLGANVLGDGFGTDGGFNVTAKIDLFPAQPLVLSGEVDMGTIGDAELFHLAGKLGLMLDRFEVFGGYDYRTIGGVPLQGAMLGLQVWF